jgi:tetratricopeptide (TPR) repeat protein
MEDQSAINALKDFEQAHKELSEGNVLKALACLEKALKLSDNRSWYSFLGFCIAKERGHLTRGYELCQLSIQYEPDNPFHYYFLGRIHLVAKSKQEAIKTLRKGMAAGDLPEIRNLLDELGTRKPAVFSRLKRSNIVNKTVGYIFSRLKIR